MHHIHHGPASVAIIGLVVLAILVGGAYSDSKRDQSGVALVAVLLIFGVLLMSGCAAVKPDTIRLEVAHASHLTQHPPFVDIGTDYGYSTIGLVAHWQRGHGYLDIGEGWAFNGELTGGDREVFTARAGLEFGL